MTDTEREALCARIDELCAEVEQGKAEFKKMDIWHSQELKAAIDENAKLREQYETVLADYRSEVAKLRELMSVMAYCNQFRRDCDGCAMNGAAGIVTERAGCDELLARLREMGVEVTA